MRTLLLLVFASALALQGQKQDEKEIQGAIDAYRKMWQAMTPEQRKNLVDAGGGTPERYEQTLRMQQTLGGSAPKATGGTGETRAASTDMVDAVRSSSEDRHAIRDANLIRLKEESCPPEVALEIAALRSTFAPAAMPPSKALLAVAETWFQRSALEAISAEKPVNVTADLERLLGECKK